jgi:hypothetical protein
MLNKVLELSMNYTYRAGLHLLECNNVEGFFVSSYDKNTLWNRAAFTMQRLLEENMDMKNCIVIIPNNLKNSLVHDIIPAIIYQNT